MIEFPYKNSQTCRYCEDDKNIISKNTCCTGCSVLEKRYKKEEIHISLSELINIISEYEIDKLEKIPLDHIGFCNYIFNKYLIGQRVDD